MNAVVYSMHVTYTLQNCYLDLSESVSYSFEMLFQESADNVDPNSSSSKDALLEEACKKYAEATRLSPTLYDVSS